tara:strand:+ start:572 stop:886 length:315 start_codon:yes stop_codon:yes gene_type:complete
MLLKIPIFAFKNLYFLDWYHGFGNEIYACYKNKQSLLKIEKIKYMNNKNIKNNKSVVEDELCWDMIIRTFYEGDKEYEKRKERKQFNKELNNFKKDIKLGNKIW